MKRLLKVEEVVEVLAISERKVWELANSGELPSLKIGRSRRFDPDDVMEYVRRAKAREARGRGRSK